MRNIVFLQSLDNDNWRTIGPVMSSNNLLQLCSVSEFPFSKKCQK